MKLIMSSLLTILFCLSSSQAYAGQESVTLTRTAVSGVKLEAQLSKDIYKSVPYQDSYEEQEAYEAQEDYTVDVPYQADETYYVDVPYQESETYYEQVPYQDTETYYERVPYEEREAYQDTETYYENEYRCHTVTEYERECKTERTCSRRPGDNQCQMVEECGTNIRGEKICKSRKVCQQGPDREECENKNVCQNIPHSREKCGNEQVAKTRTVTKYRTVTRYREERRTRTVTKYREELRTRTVTKHRQEARTRTVTKYRQETRTRTVTKYRTVTKCCVTRYREEYDHTWNLNTRVIFPAQATLLANEKEEFELQLSGTEERPEVSLSVINSIYGYKLGHKDVQTSSATIELQLAPKYNQQTLGEKLLGDVELTGDDENLNELIITDKGIVPRVLTQYRYRVLDAQSKEVAAEGEASSEKSIRNSVSIALSEALPSDADYIVQISATRSGIVLEKSFSFSVIRNIKFTRWDADDFGIKTIKNLALLEQKDKTLLSFIDKGAHPKLTTQYSVLILDKNGREISAQVLNSAEVLDANGKALVTLDPKAMELQEDLVISLAVQRTGKRLEEPVNFHLTTERIFLRLEDLKDRKKISNLGIQGQRSNARLVFRDEIRDSSKVRTEYKLTITRHGGFLGLQKKVMAQLSFNQAQMQGSEFSEFLSRLGVAPSSLEDHLTPNSTIYLDLTASRKSVSDKKVLATVKKSAELKIQN